MEIHHTIAVPLTPLRAGGTRAVLDPLASGSVELAARLELSGAPEFKFHGDTTHTSGARLFGRAELLLF